MTVYLQAATWIQNPLMVDDFRRFCIAWPYAIRQVLTGEKTMDKKGADQLFPEELEVYYGSGKGRQVGCCGVDCAVSVFVCHWADASGRPASRCWFTGSRYFWFVLQVIVAKLRQLVFDASLPMEQFAALENSILSTSKAASDALRNKLQAMPHCESSA